MRQWLHIVVKIAGWSGIAPMAEFGAEVFWMNSIDNIYMYWNKLQHCARECELLPVNAMLTVVTYSVVLTVVFTLRWMYLRGRAVCVRFF